MGVFEAVERELDQVDAAGSALGATALSLARKMDDPQTGSTSASMVAKSLTDVLREIRLLKPPKAREDELDRIRKRRDSRRAAS
jgi:hypothetical protein